MRIALFCGGPSLERGISLNSARSVLDHMGSDEIQITPIYFDEQKRAFLISSAQLYSNTPSDFDFKLAQTAKPLTNEALVKLLRSVDISFPAIHGTFGEDGEIQAFLEKNRIPFVGSGSEACLKCFDKFTANEFIRAKGFFTLPSIVLKIYRKDNGTEIDKFFLEHKIKRAIVKPAAGGSSISVFSVNSPLEAKEKAELIFSKRLDTRVVVEPFAEGVEFTAIILQNRFGLPVAIIPTEIEADYRNNQFFDFRKKYLPTRHVTYHCPPRFDNQTIERIQIQAEQLFALFGMKDFARFDGWVFPDGKIWFSDFNPISGMEQNSFLFQQASRIGLSHSDVLNFIVRNSCQRYSLSFPESLEAVNSKRMKVNVLFGGKTSERQVSLMSGTNVWLKLRGSKKFSPEPYLFDLEGKVWKLPYSYTLNHTVEEIVENCRTSTVSYDRLANLEEKVRMRLGLGSNNDVLLPQQMTLDEFLDSSKFVFNALHGGTGENGDLQKLMDAFGLSYNGSGLETSKLCMDKKKTNDFITKLNISGVATTQGIVVNTVDLEKQSGSDLKKLWKSTLNKLEAKTLIIKPASDGCSSGVIHLFNSDELISYISLVKAKALSIPKGTFKGQSEIVEMSLDKPEEFILEKFVETDVLKVKNNKLKHVSKTNWIEITVGAMGVKENIKVFNPSITVSEGEVLSVEEKFQGGTGVNITPPPDFIVRPEILIKVKENITKVASGLKLEGYARIDAFLNIKTGDVMIIEVNTLPGLTPSTVLFHQALAEDPQIFPRELLEKFIENKSYEKRGH